MRSINLIFTDKQKLRRVLATAFMLVLLAEWGSHSMIEANPLPNDAPSVSAHDLQHSDLCKTFILCSDNGRNDQQRSNLGREVPQHSTPLELLSGLSSRHFFPDASRFEFSTAHGLFRTISPPFHPPEIS